MLLYLTDKGNKFHTSGGVSQNIASDFTKFNPNFGSSFNRSLLLPNIMCNTQLTKGQSIVKVGRGKIMKLLYVSKAILNLIRNLIGRMCMIDLSSMEILEFSLRTHAH